MAFKKNSFISSYKKKYSVIQTLFDKNLTFLLFSFFVLTTSITTFWVNYSSVIAYFYFLFFWVIFIFIFDFKELIDFTFAFVFNAFLTSIFIAVQSHIYPNSYGTTSEFTVAYTDDGYFFSLIADQIPNGLVTRYDYQVYSSFYSDLIRFCIPFKVQHPLDAVYFQSGVAAILATYTKQFTSQISKDKKLVRTVYLFCILSPFLLMHGGALLIRDTLVAGLFMLSLCCINLNRWWVVVLTIIAQFSLRPGTGFILLLFYLILYSGAIKQYLSKIKNIPQIIFILAVSIVIASRIYFIFSEDINNYLLQKGVGATGRELYSDLTDDRNLNNNRVFLLIQSQPFFLKSILSGLYIFTYPFLSFSGIISSKGLDLRTLLVSFVYPIYSIWLNAWVFSIYFHTIREFKNINILKILLVLSCIIIGVFSLQTRHKTIITPLYYILAAIGYQYSGKIYKYWGFILSFFWFFAQFLIAYKK